MPLKLELEVKDLFLVITHRLIVIDGVPYAGNGTIGYGATAGIGILSMINPNDIESITVLKDASSTSVYGNRGSKV